MASLAIWGAFQLARTILIVWFDGITRGNFSTAFLIGLDKLTGNMAEDAFGLIQTYALIALSVQSTRPQPSVLPWGLGTWIIFSPNVAASVGEVADKLTKRWLHKSILKGDHWLASNTTSVVLVLVVFALVAHLFLVRIILKYMKKPKRL